MAGRSSSPPPRTTTSGETFGGYGYYGDYEADPSFWSLLHTDRDLYRPTDTVNIWGMARDRDDGTVPAAVTLRLTSWDEYYGDVPDSARSGRRSPA